jgi:polysaccharide deacetylase family protein (PEP-CTERM system associated)
LKFAVQQRTLIAHPLAPSPATPVYRFGRSTGPRVLTFTVDLEEHRDDAAAAPRYPLMTRRILDFLGERSAIGTFFVVGELVRQAPGLIREIAAAGHEIASHGFRHEPLTRQAPDAFRSELAESKARLEDLAGRPVLGFRAPMFSLTPRSLWALEILRDLGFRYSSSVLPAPWRTHGFAEAPARPFLWSNGLLEIPCPVGRVGPLTLPYLGGMYLRYLPPWRLRHLLGRVDGETLWTYCHPYDVDVDEPFHHLPGKSRVASFMLWCNRRVTLRRLDALLRGQVVEPFASRWSALHAAAPVFQPALRPEWMVPGKVLPEPEPGASVAS